LGLIITDAASRETESYLNHSAYSITGLDRRGIMYT